MHNIFIALGALPALVTGLVGELPGQSNPLSQEAKQ